MSRSAGTIKDFKGIHKGEEVAILLNGPSLLENLDYLPELTIGVNASLYHYPSDYHVALDLATIWRMCNTDYKHRPKHLFVNRIYTTAGDEIDRPPIFNYVDLNVNLSPLWSNDLERVVYTARVSMWVALQIASYMGCDPVRLVGFDLGGGHFAGHINEGKPMMSYSAAKQVYLMKRVVNYYQPKGIIKAKIYNCSPNSRCRSLPFFDLKER